VNDVTAVAAERVAQEVRDSGGTALAYAASVTDEAAIETMVGTVLDAWGNIDILVNNAGILRDKSFAKMTIADFRTVVDVHLMGAAICSKAVWEPMRQRGFGRIVMTTSSSGLYGNFGQANYGAAKMALVGLMQTLAIEGEKYGIRVNCLAPTAATGMTEGVLDAESLKMLAPERVSPALLSLLGDDAPTRAILCAGAGHFAVANITLTRGTYVGAAEDAGEQFIERWNKIADRTDEAVPAYGLYRQNARLKRRKRSDEQTSDIEELIMPLERPELGRFCQSRIGRQGVFRPSHSTSSPT